MLAEPRQPGERRWGYEPIAADGLAARRAGVVGGGVALSHPVLDGDALRPEETRPLVAARHVRRPEALVLAVAEWVELERDGDVALVGADEMPPIYGSGRMRALREMAGDRALGKERVGWHQPSGM